MTTPSNLSDFKMWCKGAGSTTIYFDDFRLQPVDASMTAYVYDEKTDELTYTLDNNNLYTRYVYDDMGRLISTAIETFDHDEFKTSEIQYTYARNDVKFDIAVSSSGGGTVSPATQQVITAGVAAIDLDYDECAYQIQEVEVDGHTMAGTSERIGGTDFALDSKKLQLTGVKGDHDIIVSFEASSHVSSGTKVYFTCQVDSEGCPTGQIAYKTADGCGGYNEGPGIYSYEGSTSCCDNPPSGCTNCNAQ